MTDSTTAPDREPLILIVDDIPRNLQVLGSILGENGYSVSVASSGQAALEAIAAQPPDLILLDIQMPDIDGIEVCKRLQSDGATKSIPVMFLTARTETDDIVRGFEVGAVDYITKPFVSTELMARVRTHLKIKHFTDLTAAQNRHLQALDDEKNELLSVVAHDLKSPLTNVQLLADMLDHKSESIAPDGIREYAQDLRQSSDRMVSLINNILNIHAIETSSYPLAIDRIDSVPLVERVVNEYKLQAEKKSIVLELAIGSDVGVETWIEADVMAFIQVVSNLVSNAVKYSPYQTTVRVRLETAAGKASGGAAESSDTPKTVVKKILRVCVQDEGPGISPKDQVRLFQKFARLTARPTGGESSTGLGLSIVKRLAEAMRGTVRYEAAQPKGSIFVAEFPIT
jgi:two-component system, sensor histidine kinase and response regulator